MSSRIGSIVVIRRSGVDGNKFPFSRSECIFGRDPTCDVRIQLQNVSKVHTKLWRDETDGSVRHFEIFTFSKKISNFRKFHLCATLHLISFIIPLNALISCHFKQTRRLEYRPCCLLE